GPLPHGKRVCIGPGGRGAAAASAIAPKLASSSRKHRVACAGGSGGFQNRKPSGHGPGGATTVHVHGQSDAASAVAGRVIGRVRSGVALARGSASRRRGSC